MFQQRSRRGESPPPFEEVVRMYSDRIFKLAFYFVQDYYDALDITQDVFLLAYKNYRKFRFESDPYTWLYRIAINRINRIRQKEARIKKVELSDNIEGGENPLDIVEKEDKINRLNKIIDSLPDVYKDVIFLKYYEGLNYKKISNLLSIPIGTVRSRLARARKSIEKMMEVGNGL